MGSIRQCHAEQLGASKRAGEMENAMYQPYDANNHKIVLLKRLYASPRWKRLTQDTRERDTAPTIRERRLLLEAWSDVVETINVYPA